MDVPPAPSRLSRRLGSGRTDDAASVANATIAPTRVEAHLYLGLVHLFTAEFEIARAHLEDAIALYERPDHPDQIYEALGDSGAGAMAYLAVVLWTLGYVDEALERSEQSLRLAGEVARPMTNAQVWGMRAMLHLARKEPALTAEWASKTVAFASDRSIPYWLNLSSLLDAWLRARISRSLDGLVQFRDTLDGYLATGAKLGLPDFTLLLADLYRVNRDPAAGLEAIRQAEIHIEDNGRAVLRVRSPAGEGRAAPGAWTSRIWRRPRRRWRDRSRWRRRNGHGSPNSARRRPSPGCSRSGARWDRYDDALEEACAWFSPTTEIADVLEVRALLAQLGANVEGVADRQPR